MWRSSRRPIVEGMEMRTFGDERVRRHARVDTRVRAARPWKRPRLRDRLCRGQECFDGGQNPCSVFLSPAMDCDRGGLAEPFELI